MLNAGCAPVALNPLGSLTDSPMRPRASDTLARLRVCREARIQIPDDLVNDAIEIIEQSCKASALKSERDRLIRLAAVLLPSGSSAWNQARQLLKEAGAMNRRRPIAAQGGEDLTTVQGCLRAASKIRALPETDRQFYRIIAPCKH